MERKTFTYKLLDEKTYTFSERDQGDFDYTVLQDKLRASRFNFIQGNVTHEDMQMPLLLQEMNRVYNDQEISLYISGSKDEMTKLVYASIKIAHPEITLERFEKITDKETVTKLSKMLSELEKIEETSDVEIIKELGIKKEQLDEWKRSQPSIYYHIKKSLIVKKKVQTSVVK